MMIYIDELSTWFPKVRKAVFRGFKKRITGLGPLWRAHAAGPFSKNWGYP